MHIQEDCARLAADLISLKGHLKAAGVSIAGLSTLAILVYQLIRQETRS